MLFALSRKLNPILKTVLLLVLMSFFSPSLSFSASSMAKPILLISSSSNPFSSYYGEILTTEGFNSFDERDIANLSTDLLSSYDVVLLGKTALTTSQVDILTAWVNGGGNLIAMRPDAKLADLLGLARLGATTADAYLRVNNSSGAGIGITGETIQYHGTADLYDLQGASAVATLYASASTATSNPAVTLRSVGNNGGEAAAFTYDLAASVVSTRQGNPAWSGQERDGYRPIRSDDLFYGNANFDPRPDWIDLDKVAIPQADEQQRLLANLIVRMNMNQKPLPRFWYFPRSLPAVVVMTGDDHGNWNGTGGTAGRFDQYISLSAPGCSVDNWECIRGTSYVYPDLALTNTQASKYNNAGFEVALHLNTDCADWTPATLTSFLDTQLGQWQSKYPALPAPLTNRTHCIVWSDYASQPAVEQNFGIRLDTNYYFWPPGWVANTPGFFTGSGMPMRFTDAGGNLIDVYQAPTQMTDESGQSYPYTIDTLLNRATGPEGYYGAFVANIHTDTATSAASDAIVNSAKARDIPVVSARQLLKWLDERNSSAYGDLSWDGSTLGFSIATGSGANGLTVMVPMVEGKSVSRVTNNGNSIPFATETIKGVKYVVFPAMDGTWEITYSSGTDTVAGSYSIWSNTTVPGTLDAGPDSPVELGVKFRSDSSGSITGIRFYKAATNTGAHVANLWSSSGTRLATATFTGESPSGWQQVNFSTPVAITANTVYIASYHTNTGHYSFNLNFFSGKGQDNPPLHAIADGVSGGNGVFAYGSTSAFPNQSWNASNYWVDVVFAPGVTQSDTTPPTVTAFTIPSTATSLTIGISSFTATDNVAVSGYLVTESATAPSATASGWTTSAPTSYTFATAGSKTLYAWAKDAAGNVSSNRSDSVVITVVVSDSYSIWSSTTVPGIVDSGPDSPVELGVKFRSDSSGSITGIRFYKAATNTDVHVANLWSSSGARLATATFSGESASGWQQVNFTTPVAIAANTVYVASYHTNTGHYSFNLNFFNNRSVDNPPLHAIANGVSGGNGVFAYGSSSAFPNQSWNASNYWVDVVLAP